MSFRILSCVLVMAVLQYFMFGATDAVYRDPRCECRHVYNLCIVHGFS